jgi:methyl-accepting chemotaxis protein
MKKMTMNQKLGSMIAVLWVGLVAIGMIGAWQNRSSMIDDRREALTALVNQAYSTVAHNAALVENKTLTGDEAKKRALDVVGAMRYGKDGYLSINDSRPVMVMHPIKPEMNGRDLSNYADPAGNKLFIDIAKAGNAQESGGFISYFWPKPGSDKPVKKMS